MAVAGTAALGLAALLCAAAAMRAGGRAGRADPRLGRAWWFVTAMVAGFALYRASGAEYRLGDTLRTMARSRGFYDGRQVVQAAVTILALVLATGCVTWIIGRRSLPLRLKTALMAISAYAMLSLMRVASLHGVDRILYGTVVGLKINWLTEAALLFSIAGAALFTVAERRR